MNESLQRLESLFAEAVALPLAARAEFLDRACADDAELRARLEGLLRASSAVGGFLETAMVPGFAEAALGAKIGRYKLLEKIGEGGAGVVFMAEQEEPVRRKVAVKVIKPGMDSREVIARFESERQALALMEHPNIARVLDAGATDTGRPFFVMELVRGIPITRYCDEENLSTSQRLELFVQVCHAIQHAHQKGIIHRDIKPSNILVTMHDDVAVPKVIDFGIAKATQGRLTDKTVFTAFEQFMGTPAYMSPEQAQFNDLDVDARSDIYSLGVLLYELLTGRPPFDPKTLKQCGIDEIRRIIREVEPPRPSEQLSTLSATDRATIAKLRGMAPAQLTTLMSGDLDWIAMKAIEKKRARRYESAGSLAADVKRHLSHEPVIARPPSTAYRLQKFTARHRFALGAAAAVVVALGIGFGMSKLAFHAGTPVTAAPSAVASPAAPSDVEIRKLPLKDAAAVWAVSNSGRFVAYRPNSGSNDLALFETATGKSSSIVNGSAEKRIWSGVRFSPDDRRIAHDYLSRTINISMVDGSGTQEIYKRDLTNNEWLEVVGWTPDASQLIVVHGADAASAKPSIIGLVDVQNGSWKDICRITPGGYSLSSDGRYTAIWPNMPGQSGKLLLLDLETGRETTLVDSNVIEIVGWLPGGKKLLYASDSTGTKSLWAITVENGAVLGEPELLKSKLEQASAVGVAADGTVFYTEPRTTADVYVMAANFETGETIREPRRVLERFPGVQGHPKWSHDGQTLLMAIQRDPLRFITFSLATGAQGDYPLASGQVQKSSWAEADDFVLFQSNLPGAKNGIHRFDLPTGKTETLMVNDQANVWNCQPELSPDGTCYYCFRREYSKTSDGQTDWTDRIIRRDLRSATEEVVYGPAEKLNIFQPVLVSQDGRQLAFISDNGRKENWVAAIKVLRLSTGQTKEVFRNTPQRTIDSFAWTPDGKRIVCKRSGGAIVSIAVDSGETKTMQFRATSVRDMAVHPDGRQIAFSYRSGKEGQDLWAVRVAPTPSPNPGKSIPAFRGISIPVGDLAGSNHSFIDRNFGLSAKLPSGWSIKDAIRGDAGVTAIGFVVPEVPDARAFIYYRTTPPGQMSAFAQVTRSAAPEPKTAAELGPWMRLLAEHQAVSENGKMRSESFTSLKIGGHKAWGWISDVSDDENRDLIAYIVIVESGKNGARFALRAPKTKFEVLRPAFDAMVNSLRMP